MENEDYQPFGKRIGAIQSEDIVQINSIDKEFRTDLWNFLLETILPQPTIYGFKSDSYENYIIRKFLREPVDQYSSLSQVYHALKKVIFEWEWYYVYEFLERTIFFIKAKNFKAYTAFCILLSNVLKSNNSGYRLVDDIFVPIVNEEEIKEIVFLANSTLIDKLKGLSEHLSKSLKYLSQKPEPDYRNSIKESISMVEVICRIIEPENTLGAALKKLNKNQKINSTLFSAFEKLYVYTNEKNGVRHALMDSTEKIDMEEARFFLVACSAFCNYLIEKANKIDR